MKKSTVFAMMLGTVSGVLFALGMCMALIPEWEAFSLGIGLGCAGLVLGVVTWAIWRHMAGKAPIRLSGKLILRAVILLAGVLILGVGMCLCMVWDQMLPGILVGLVGILLLLSLVPLVKGIQA